MAVLCISFAMMPLSSKRIASHNLTLWSASTSAVLACNKAPCPDLYSSMQPLRLVTAVNGCCGIWPVQWMLLMFFATCPEQIRSNLEKPPCCRPRFKRGMHSRAGCKRPYRTSRHTTTNCRTPCKLQRHSCRRPTARPMLSTFRSLFFRKQPLQGKLQCSC